MEKTFHMLLYRAFHAQRNYLRPYLTAIGLGSGQPKLLGYLMARGPCPQKELAEYYDIDRAAVSRMLDSLEKGGFVTLNVNAQNRRADLVELTERGKEAYAAWQAHCEEMERLLLSEFTPEEKTEFASYLARAYQNLKAETSGEGSH